MNWDKRRQIVSYLKANHGVPDGETYYSVGVKFALFDDIAENADDRKKLGQKVENYWRYFNDTGREVPEQQSEVEMPYENLMPRKVWESQVKGGGKMLLHSYEFDVKEEDLDSYKAAITNRFAEAVKTVVPVIWKKLSDNGKALCIYTADKHVGASTSENSVFENTYDAKVFDERMMALLAEIEEQKRIHGAFKEVLFFELGDAVDGYGGMTTRGGHTLDQNLDDREQFDTYVGTHKAWFDGAVKIGIGNEYRFIAMSNSNHDGPFGYMCERAVEIYLNARYPEIKTKVSKALVEHVQVGEHVIMASHGKDEKYMKHGFPKNIDAKTESWINNYIDYHGLQHKVPSARVRGYYLHFIKGDLHQSNEEFVKRFRYKNVLSVYGSSNYIHPNYGFSLPGAEFEIMDLDRYRVQNIKVYF